MVPRGPRKPKPKPNHYTQQRREEEAAYDAGLGPKLDYMFTVRSSPQVLAAVYLQYETSTTEPHNMEQTDGLIGLPNIRQIYA